MTKTFFVALVGSVSAFGAPAFAACPEDLEALEANYQAALSASPESETVLSTEEITEVGSMRRAAQRLYDAGEDEACAAAAKQGLEFLENARAPRILSAAALKDRDLANRDGESLGEIEDVAIDPSSGRIAYIIVDHGGFAGVGADFFALPWALVRDIPNDESNDILVDLSEEKLQKAPRVDPDTWQQTADRNWGRSVHEYFGLQPYWLQQDRTAAGYLTALENGSGQAASETMPVMVDTTTAAGETAAPSPTPPATSDGNAPSANAAGSTTNGDSGVPAATGESGSAVTSSGNQGATNKDKPADRAATTETGTPSATSPATATPETKLAPEIADLSMKVDALTQALVALREQQRKTEESLKDVQGQLEMAKTNGAETRSSTEEEGQAGRPATSVDDTGPNSSGGAPQSGKADDTPSKGADGMAPKEGSQKSGSVASEADETSKDSTTN